MVALDDHRRRSEEARTQDGCTRGSAQEGGWLRGAAQRSEENVGQLTNDGGTSICQDRDIGQ